MQIQASEDQEAVLEEGWAGFPAYVPGILRRRQWEDPPRRSCVIAEAGTGVRELQSPDTLIMVV